MRVGEEERERGREGKTIIERRHTHLRTYNNTIL